MAVKNLMLDKYSALRDAIFNPLPVIRVELNGPTAMALCDDGALLAVLHLPANHVLQMLRSQELFAKCADLKSRSPWAYVLISGQLAAEQGNVKLDGKSTSWNWNALQGALLTVQELGIAVMYIDGEQAVGNAVLSLGKRSRDAKRVPPMRATLAFTPGEQLLMSLPGIGPDLMDRLLQHCTTAATALQALTCPDGAGVAGIGEETIKHVRAAMGLRPGELLLVDKEANYERARAAS